VAGSCALWREGFYPKSDLLLAFLPLSHILEQVGPGELDDRRR
jgi:long-subunit acyl-CoA synthetase (AMP-forming)